MWKIVSLWSTIFLCVEGHILMYPVIILCHLRKVKIYKLLINTVVLNCKPYSSLHELRKLTSIIYLILEK